MAQPLIGGITPDLALDSDYQIQFTALDASTGAVVTSVNISNASILVRNVKGGDLSNQGNVFEFTWLNVPQEG